MTLTILETNKAYTDAMQLLGAAKMAAYTEKNDFVVMALYHAANHLTDSQRELIHRAQLAGAQ